MSIILFAFELKDAPCSSQAKRGYERKGKVASHIVKGLAVHPFPLQMEGASPFHVKLGEGGILG